ncbi:MAG: truC 1 [Verrucomicrobiales bacterium]|nr:truC 1 [Verrucomicrobiales bacterium]
MAKPKFIELGFGKRAEQLPIVYEDRSVIAIDKPAGWMLVPFSWQKTSRNLQAAITSSIAAGDYWARSRNLKFLKAVHRLDADTSGILLFAKSMGAVDSYGDLFESRKMEKVYLAVSRGVPKEKEWTCELKLSQDPDAIGRVKVDDGSGKECQTSFKLLETRESSSGPLSLIEAHPYTGRTHQIRVHLAEAQLPIVGDPLYGYKAVLNTRGSDPDFPLGLRAVALSYVDPFINKRVDIRAPKAAFLKAFGF